MYKKLIKKIIFWFDAYRFLASRFIYKNRNFLGDKVLDYGSGNGHYESFLKDLAGTYLKCDILNKDVDILINKNKIDISDNYFSSVICLDVLQHSENPKKTLKEIHRVLKSNGFLMLSVASNCPEADFLDFSRWSKKGIENLLKKNNFRDIEIYQRGGILFLLITNIFMYLNNVLIRNRIDWKIMSRFLRVTLMCIKVIFTPLLFMALLIDFFIPKGNSYFGLLIKAKK